MTKQSNSPITLTAGEDLTAFMRVKVTASRTVWLADSVDFGIGVVQAAVDQSENPQACIRLYNAPGTCKMVASGAISAGAPVYAANSGKVAASGTIKIGTALDAATANNDVIEVIPQLNLNNQSSSSSSSSSSS